MKYLLYPFQAIYTLYFLLLYASGLTLGFTATIILSLLMGKKAHMPIFRFMKVWIGAIFTISGVRMKVYGKEIRDQYPPCIIVSNHSTNLDLITAPYMLPVGTKPLAKKELLKVPILGLQFKVMSVTVDRKDKESRRKSLFNLKKNLENGIHIFIYPEGTRNRTALPLKEFYEGAFKIAIDMQQPIMPVVTVGARSIWPMNSFLIKPGLISAYYLPPIDTKGMTDDDLPALKQKVFDMMHECIMKNDPLFNRNK
jgi:1-acyl-sn-glycerol-3-phosphate acyltransferase